MSKRKTKSQSNPKRVGLILAFALLLALLAAAFILTGGLENLSGTAVEAPTPIPPQFNIPIEGGNAWLEIPLEGSNDWQQIPIEGGNSWGLFLALSKETSFPNQAITRYLLSTPKHPDPYTVIYFDDTRLNQNLLNLTVVINQSREDYGRWLGEIEDSLETRLQEAQIIGTNATETPLVTWRLIGAEVVELGQWRKLDGLDITVQDLTLRFSQIIDSSANP